jgi:hypothetical protein
MKFLWFKRQAKIAEYVELVKTGVLSPNDVRAAFDLNPIEGGDTVGIMTPTGWLPLKMVGKYFGEPNSST